MKLMIAGLMLAFAVMLSGCAEEEPEADIEAAECIPDKHTDCPPPYPPPPQRPSV